MAISRQPRRVSPVVVGLVVLAAIVLILAGVWIVQGRAGSPPPDSEDVQRQLVAEKTQRMMEGLDVLAISHYTEEVVQDGEVLLPNEYQAARQNLQELRQIFQDVQPYLDPGPAAEIDSALATLREMVESKQPAAQVQEQAEALITMLSEEVRTE